MEPFETRERGFENAFAHDEAVSFRVRIGALRKLGRWAAQTLPHGPADAQTLVARALEGADDATLLAELAGAGVSAHRIRARFAAFQQEAAREIHGLAASGANHVTT